MCLRPGLEARFAGLFQIALLVIKDPRGFQSTSTVSTVLRPLLLSFLSPPLPLPFSCLPTPPHPVRVCARLCAPLFVRYFSFLPLGTPLRDSANSEEARTLFPTDSRLSGNTDSVYKYTMKDIILERPIIPKK